MITRMCSHSNVQLVFVFHVDNIERCVMMCYLLSSTICTGPAISSIITDSDEPLPSLSDGHDYEPQLEFDDTELEQSPDPSESLAFGFQRTHLFCHDSTVLIGIFRTLFTLMFRLYSRHSVPSSLCLCVFRCCSCGHVLLCCSCMRSCDVCLMCAQTCSPTIWPPSA